MTIQEALEQIVMEMGMSADNCSAKSPGRPGKVPLHIFNDHRNDLRCVVERLKEAGGDASQLLIPEKFPALDRK